MTKRAKAKKRAAAGVEGSTRRESAYDAILSAIIFGDLEAGSAVDEKGIVRRFGLRLAAVRDALNRLSLEGLVERQPRIGTRIPDLGLRDLQDVFEARILLEGSCAALAAERASPDDIAAMRSAFRGYEETIRQRDFRQLVRMDQAFHRTMAVASQNRQIERQLVLLHNNASRFWYFGLPRIDPAAISADIAGHLDVVDAIEKHNGAAARSAMSAVLGHFPDNVRFFLSGTVAVEEGQVDVRSPVDRWERKRPQKGSRAATIVS